jgi:hypothetical protein
MTFCDENIIKIFLNTIPKFFMFLIFIIYFVILNIVTYFLTCENCIELNINQFNILKDIIKFSWVIMFVFISIWLYKVSTEFKYYTNDYIIIDTIIYLIMPILYGVILWELSNQLLQIKPDCNSTEKINYCLKPYNLKIFTNVIILLWIVTVIFLLIIFKRILNPVEEQKYIDANIDKQKKYESLLNKKCCYNNDMIDDKIDDMIDEYIDYKRCLTKNQNIKIKNYASKARNLNNKNFTNKVTEIMCKKLNLN